ncbi:RNA ligase-domain-containing protein [Infundibulicybe gibba]|nr:RNA ligase-domain-containing protein [Infundibulicybe gibba]
MAPGFSPEDSDLITQLQNISKASPKLIKSSQYAAPADPNISVKSWKMNEFKYYDVPSPFPTLARGLFTTELHEGPEDTAGGTRHRIVARGYDKFFNIGEVPWTTWPSIEAYTRAPYTLSLKSNGCIIFIAALTPSRLLITSKHSIGHVAGSAMSHAEAGEEQLAAVLWEKNWTAIAELCDDSFEEHVIGYPPDKTGLHLHGINDCSKEFKTHSQDTVDAFAEEWGFIKTLSTSMGSAQEVRSFTDKIAKTGKWNGEAVEGFVVRTHVSIPPVGGTAAQTGKDAPKASPYAPGSSFFFKIKFDEPYMMYRDWREATKSIITNNGSTSKVSKGKLRRPETRVYVKWVANEITKDPKAFETFNKGKGIIATRERFLAWLDTDGGKGELKSVKSDTGTPANNITFGKTIIVPIAIPGCGKTTVSLVLSNLFGFGHTQSDDVRVKKAAPAFIKNVANLLKEHNVVIADKNNHLRIHRQSLRSATSTFNPPVRLLALNWSLDKPPATVHRICDDRVVRRGENHQTLRADQETKVHEEVIWKFIAEAEELAESEVDQVVEMELEETLEKQPSQDQITRAIEATQAYSAEARKSDDKKKPFAPRYFGLLPEIDLELTLGNTFTIGKGIPEQGKLLWEKLAGAARVAKRPHITIIHAKSMDTGKALWDRCMALHGMRAPPVFRAHLGHVVWDDRVMAITVENLQSDGGEGQEGAAFMSSLPEEVRERLHVTVGTADKEIPAVEAMALVEKWRKGEPVQSFKLDGGTIVQGRIKGLFG